MKAGKLLMKKYNLYWTPCEAHCIDLMFEDIGKRDSVAQLIGNGRKITNFIYNHGWLLAKCDMYVVDILCVLEQQDLQQTILPLTVF